MSGEEENDYYGCFYRTNNDMVVVIPWAMMLLKIYSKGGNTGKVIV